MKKILLIATAVLLMASCCNKTEEDATGIGQDEATLATIHSRKSVRTFTPEQVPDSIINLALRAAMAAPSGMNIQPWHFVVLRDTAKYQQTFGDNFNMPIYMQSSAVVVFCADTTVTRPPRENPDAPAETRPNRIWRDDLGACTENFLLAIEAMGYGAVWTACYPYAERMDPVRAALNLPSHVIPYCVVPIGRPGGDDQPKDKYKPERIHSEVW